MSIQTASYFHSLKPKLYEKFIWQIDEWNNYDRAVSEFRHANTRHFICLVAQSGGLITHISAARKVKRAGLDQVTISLFDIEKLEIPVDPLEVLAQVPANVDKTIRKVFEKARQIAI